eukprot:CAMPEP_0197446618 /NCGR_PEP_ID=MMETSP1175-20131217/11527_1 /TAXON_ID=1003142 /ORGANISM="Triceratium dubium, Strain CCMP147" /LENGTH=106 /DNA_ID=CAMNT_0042977765 /DNA_START=306 /DNA_END=623 /DNA_ORIENTATION=+
MSVLAKEPGAYDVYAGLIRREYVHVDKDVYCSKRAEVLTSFLQNGRPIFACEAMREAGLEERARKNVEREVRLLKEGVIPGECDWRRLVVDGVMSYAFRASPAQIW